MKAKYTRERLDGTFYYPDCPDIIKSKEDLIRWFEHTGQFTDDINDRQYLLSHLPAGFIKENTDKVIKIMFPRYKSLANAYFTDNECYKIAV